MLNRNLPRFATIAAVLMLAACASTPPSTVSSGTQASSGVQSPTPTAPLTSLKGLTHADLQAAAAYATAHGYPARAAMWTAIESQLTAAENQIAACKAAIAAAAPKPGDSGVIGLFTLTEVAAEAVAQGISASVKANCEPIVVPAGLLPIPRL